MVFFDTVDWHPQTGNAVAQTVARFGFSGIICNEHINAPDDRIASNQMPRCKMTNIQIPVPKHFRLNDNEAAAASLLIDSNNIQPNHLIQIRRLTIKLSNPTQIGYLNSVARSHQYDLIAVTPLDEKTWISLLSQGEFDIISLDLTSGRLPFPLRRQALLQLSRRNIFFEIRLAEAIRDSSSRKNLFTNIQNLIRFLPHNQIFFSSGATHPLGVRGPYDICNIAELVGILDNSKQVLSSNIISSLYKGASRRTAGGAIGIVQFQENKKAAKEY